MTLPCWLRRAVRNRHRHAIEQASHRWRGGRREDSARTPRKILISHRSNDIKGATVAVLALSGWNKDKQPTTPKGMRWVRKAAEECRPLPKLEVVMLLPKPDPKNLENGWSDGREVQRLLEEKLHKKACKDAKNASKRAKKAEGFAKKVRSRRPVVWRRLHFTDTTRVHRTMTWVVSFSILSAFRAA